MHDWQRKRRLREVREWEEDEARRKVRLALVLVLVLRNFLL